MTMSWLCALDMLLFMFIFKSVHEYINKNVTYLVQVHVCTWMYILQNAMYFVHVHVHIRIHVHVPVYVHEHEQYILYSNTGYKFIFMFMFINMLCSFFMFMFMLIDMDFRNCSRIYLYYNRIRSLIKKLLKRKNVWLVKAKNVVSETI